MKNLLIIFLTLIAPSACFAGTWTGWGEIVQVYPYPDRSIVYLRHTVTINPDSCASTSYYALPKSNSMFGDLYSLFLAGHSAKKQMKVFINGCEGGYPKITMGISKNE